MMKKLLVENDEEITSITFYDSENKSAKCILCLHILSYIHFLEWEPKEFSFAWDETTV